VPMSPKGHSMLSIDTCGRGDKAICQQSQIATG
jgi:hypothetical protein